MSSRGLGYILVGVFALAMGAMAIPACVGDDPNTGTAAVDAGPEATPGPAALGGNGVPCSDAKACQSGQCIDGVCCEAKCDGVCEKCNLAGSVGTCAPVADGQDPDKECPTIPLPALDAGAPVDLDAGDGGDAGELDAAVVDAGPSFNVPDGGLPATDSNQCGGHCNGKRACAFAGKEASCGTAFCGNTSQQGRASCDGAGHCLYGVEECSAYACPDGSPGCKASCTAASDCLATHFCDGTSGTCKPRLANGVGCAGGIQCQSGICDTGICCNTFCTGDGTSCATPGKEGTCICPACADGPCALFYKDGDNDTYGDADGNVADKTAMYACANKPPPAGFVLDHTDCLDVANAAGPKVRPNQSAFFDVEYTNKAGVLSWDYNCSGQPEKKVDENGVCGVCNDQQVIFYPFADDAPPPPEASGKPEPEGAVYIPVCTHLYNFSTSCKTNGQTGGHTCNGCGAVNSAFFSTTIECGATGSSSTCNKCASASGSPTKVYAGQLVQSCH